jgi:putative ABC transport system permease protein
MSALAWLLVRLTSDDEGEALAGDLVESYAERRARGQSAARARLWLARETLAAALFLISHRRTRRAPSPRHDGRWDMLRSDVRSAIRLVQRAPGFTAIVTLTLALAIGGTTAIFSVVNALLLRPLPFPEADRLVSVFERGADGERSNTGWATFDDLATRARSIERMAAIGGWEPMLAGPDGAERLTGQRVSADYFRVLGVRPALGRDFVSDEDRDGSHRVLVISHALWRRHFASDSAVIGRQVLLGGDVPYTVIGVMPPSFENVTNPQAEAWRPLAYDASLPWACRTCRHLRVLARMRPDATVEQARAELDALMGALVAEHPRDYPASGVHVVPLRESVTGPLRPILGAVAGAMALVLLIAVANVANLQLGRAIRREEEFAIRRALGAGGRRIARQLLAEGLVLASFGGAAGVLLALVVLPVLVRALPSSLPRVRDIALDPTAVAVAVALVIAIGVVTGLAPLWRAGTRGVADALRGGLRLTSSAGARRARGTLVVFEVALALMLLTGAGLLGRSLVRLLAVDPGFDTRRLLALEVQVAGARYDSAAAVYEHHARLLEAVRAIPGVMGADVASQMPLSGNFDAYGVRAQDKPLANPELAPSADRYTVTPGFMRTLDIPLRAGRAFIESDDRANAPPVAMVSAALAARIWPGEDPIGKRIQMGDPQSPWREVVGVVGDVHHRALEDATTLQVYVPERQWPWAETAVVLAVRTAGDPGALGPLVRRAVLSVDPTAAIARVATMEQLVATTTAQRRLALTLFGAFAAVALLLAVAGIYGVLASSVTERTREIAVRSALGAAPRDIVALIVTHGARLALPGLALGLAGALLLSRHLRALLYAVEPTDPITLGLVSLALAAVALVACLVPARRAARVDVNVALREE